MNIVINQRVFDIAEGAKVVDALQAFGAKPPFAVALNGQFVARNRYTAQALSQNDRLDVVQPVTGG
ncbi:thiamine biosynthesis protein ThiS [Robbsia andropogonis]|uniref:Thiamine biosynthesis protein ThiS n=1 Tax=Robbsia andropogonis TaxID=28092 RepID=A0A0F5JYA7_9BURK|nr:sulfur carrier protein ThiS [Robbsia andropogonis]KKB62272.1 thiamine biosynthesis protein ThiS [Robbsia andropogonis]MCP1120544.1 sulfur carrier protein ThiS [Robbsia andropogonis]MCP1130505.1 sulfur carrier protein ThiS [Robbsia andropogonis]